jgi:hypothetical protein
LGGGEEHQGKGGKQTPFNRVAEGGEQGRRLRSVRNASYGLASLIGFMFFYWKQNKLTKITNDEILTIIHDDSKSDINCK